MNKKVILWVRIIFGILLIGMGAMSFINAQLPEGYSAEALAFLEATNLYLKYFIGLVFLIVGFMFVLNRYVALGAILLAPITINIILFHLFFDLPTIIPGLVFMALNIFVAWSEWEKYKAILKSR